MQRRDPGGGSSSNRIALNLGSFQQILALGPAPAVVEKPTFGEMIGVCTHVYGGGKNPRQSRKQGLDFAFGNLTSLALGSNSRLV